MSNTYKATFSGKKTVGTVQTEMLLIAYFNTLADAQSFIAADQKDLGFDGTVHTGIDTIPLQDPAAPAAPVTPAAPAAPATT